MGVPSLPDTGFGVSLSDFDNDGDLDLYVANGAVKRLEGQLLAGESYPLRQPNRLWINEGLMTIEPELRADLIRYQKAIVVKWEYDGTQEFELSHSVHTYYHTVLLDEEEPVMRKGRFVISVNDPFKFNGDKEMYATRIVWWGRRGGLTVYLDVEARVVASPSRRCGAGTSRPTTSPFCCALSAGSGPVARESTGRRSRPASDGVAWRCRPTRSPGGATGSIRPPPATTLGRDRGTGRAPSADDPSRTGSTAPPGVDRASLRPEIAPPTA